MHSAYTWSRPAAARQVKASAETCLPWNCTPSSSRPGLVKGLQSHQAPPGCEPLSVLDHGCSEGQKNSKHKRMHHVTLFSQNLRRSDPLVLNPVWEQQANQDPMCICLQETGQLNLMSFDDRFDIHKSEPQRIGRHFHYGVAVVTSKVLHATSVEICPHFVMAVRFPKSNLLIINVYWPNAKQLRDDVIKQTSAYLDSVKSDLEIVVVGDLNFTKYKSQLSDFQSQYSLRDARKLFRETLCKPTFFPSSDKRSGSVCDLVLLSSRYCSMLRSFHVHDLRVVAPKVDHACLVARFCLTPKWKVYNVMEASVKNRHQLTDISALPLDCSNRAEITSLLNDISLSWGEDCDDDDTESSVSCIPVPPPSDCDVSEESQHETAQSLEELSKLARTRRNSLKSLRRSIESPLATQFGLFMSQVCSESLPLGDDVARSVDSSQHPLRMMQGSTSLAVTPSVQHPCIIGPLPTSDITDSTREWIGMDDPFPREREVGSPHPGDLDQPAIVVPSSSTQGTANTRVSSLNSAFYHVNKNTHPKFHKLVEHIEEAKIFLPRKLPSNPSDKPRTTYVSQVAKDLSRLYEPITPKTAMEILQEMEQQRYDRITKVITELHDLFKKKPKFGFDKLQAFTQKQSGKIKSTPSECVNHFQNILSPPGGDSTVSTLPKKKELPSSAFIQIDERPPTLGELEKILRKCRPNRACGTDGIPWEIWFAVRKFLLKAFVEIWQSGVVPLEWRTSIVVPVPKKGDLADIVNYRPVALLPHAAKLFNAILLRRLRSALDSHVSFAQNGFRPNRNTLQHVATLQQLISNAESRKDLPLYCCFVDFKNAFSCISWRALQDTLDYYHCPFLIRSLVLSIYSEHKVSLRLQGQMTEEFNLSRGVLQGDTLSPFLFILALQRVLDRVDGMTDFGEPAGQYLGEVQRGASRLRKQILLSRLRYLAYADDLVLLADKVEDLQAMLQSIEVDAAEIGLSINYGVGKTECMHFGTKGNFKMKLKNMSGQLLRVVDSYKYLGVTISKTESSIHLTKRIQTAWATANRFRTLWKSQLDIGLKRTLFLTLIEPTLLYGSGLRFMSKRALARVHAAHSELLQYCLNLKLGYSPTQVLNGPHLEDLYADAIYPVEATMLQQRLNMFGHWVRGHRERRLPHPFIPLLNFDLDHFGYNLRRGKQKKSVLWGEHLCEMFNRELSDLQDLCMDRGLWNLQSNQKVHTVVREFWLEHFRKRAQNLHYHPDAESYANLCYERYVGRR